MILAVVATVMMILMMSEQQTMAMRTLEGEAWLQKRVVVQSLRRGPVQGPHGNPCNTIPGQSHGRCTSQINVARHVALPHDAPHAFPDNNEPAKFGAASVVNNDTLQHN